MVEKKVYISFHRNRKGDYVADFAKEVFVGYSNKQIESLLKKVDGFDVIECKAKIDEKGRIASVVIPVPTKL